VLRVERLRLARALDRFDFEKIAADIDRDRKPRSRALPSATVRYTEAFATIRPRVRNVVGIVRGSDPKLAADAIVVGAHYDHLGHGGQFSRAPQSAGEIHNGADDNASGTAAVIEMARMAGLNRARFKRSVVFVTFAGEEIGLLGSKQYVARAPISLLRTRAMINLDMIGRAHGRVMVGGTDKNPLLRLLVEELRPDAGLRLDGFREGYEEGASDDASFLRERVPVLALFTGFHDDYHRPSDDSDRIDADGAASIATIALAIVERLASRN
jgi:Zn-dependent M28 family amino/carboxypeptidase